MAQYTWNIPKWIDRQLPVDLRQPREADWLRALLAGVRSLHLRFRTYVDDARYEQQLDGTVWQLERVLNDRFDKVQRRIRVEDSNRTLVQFWKLGEGPNVQMWKLGEGPSLQMWTQGEALNEFFVFVPVTLWVTLQQTRPLSLLRTIRTYKTVGPTFRVFLF